MVLSWLEAVPVGLVGLLWLLVPGLLVTYAIGLRGIAAAGLAPVISIGEVGVLAVLAPKAGIGWSVPVAVLGCLVVAAVVAGVAFAVRTRVTPRAADPRSVTVAGLAGLAPAALLGAVVLVLGLHHPDELSQTYDAVFHYNAVALVLDTHNGSSLGLGALGNAGIPQAFYPAAWHDLTALVVRSTGCSVPLAANMFSAAAALVVWPLSCVLLARLVFGPSRLALAVTGLLSMGFTTFPWGLLGFGILWPNLLSMVIAPAGLALVVSITGLATADPIGRGRAWLLLPVLLAAGALAQPNVLFSLAALALFPVAVALVRRAVRLWRAGRRLRGPVELVLAAAVAGAGWWWAATTPALAPIRSMYWPPFLSPAQAAGRALLNSASGPDPTNGFVALWVLSALVVLGILLCGKQSGLRWVVAGYAVSGFLYVLTAAVNRPSTQKFTGYWYNDAYRLAAMLPITTVPLAVAAVVFLAQRLTALAGQRSWLPARRAVRAGLAGVVVLALVLIGTEGLYLRDHAAVLAYRRVDTLTGVNQEGWLANPAEQAFFARIKDRIPPDAVVAGNPWDGSGLLWALADRRTLFPHLGLATSPAQDLLAAHLSDLDQNPAVCVALHQLHVGYLLIGNGRFWRSGPIVAAAVNAYPGLADPGARPGFTLLDSAGDLKLYRITGCAG